MGVRVRWAGRRPRLWRSVITRAGGRRGADPGQRRADAAVLRQLRRPGRDRRRRPPRSPSWPRPAGSTRPRSTSRPFAPVPGRARTSPTSTCSSRSSGEQRTSNFLLWQSATPSWSSWTGCGPTSTAATCGGPSSSTRAATAATAEPYPTRPSRRPSRQNLVEPGSTGSRRRQQLAQVPKISRSWLTSRKPCSAATALAQRSTAGPADLDGRDRSDRQTRWWWWPVEQRR